MCPKLIELLSWNGPSVHVYCFMLARASTKTFVSRDITITLLLCTEHYVVMLKVKTGRKKF